MAQLKIEKQIGKRSYEFTVEGSNLHELVLESQKFSFPDIHTCGICGSDNLVLSAHVAQDTYAYTTIKCLSCRGSVNFGQQKKNPDVFYIRTREESGKKVHDWVKFQSNQQNVTQRPQQVGGYPQQPQQGYPQQQNYPQQGGYPQQGYPQQGGYQQPY